MDWTHKDKNKDLQLVPKEPLRISMRTRINITGWKREGKYDKRKRAKEGQGVEGKKGEVG